MKIIHAIASFEVGGGEMLALRLASYQRSRGEDVSVCALSEQGPLREHFEKAGVKTIVLEKSAGFDIGSYARISLFIAKYRPQVIHTHNPQTLVYFAPVAKMMRIRVIHTKHGDAIDTPRRMALRRFAAHFVNAFVSVSEQTDVFARYHQEANPQKLYVIENGVDIHAQKPNQLGRNSLRKQLGLTPDDFVIGTVGRLEAVKNQELLIDAACSLILEEAERSTYLLIVGDGSQRTFLEDKIKALKLDSHIKLLGYRSDITRCIAAFDTFALSSHTEGLPLALIEAMAVGRAIVSTDVGGIRLALNGQGILVSAGDKEALNKAFRRLRDEPKLADSLGEHAKKEAIKRFAFEKMARKYNQLYNGDTNINE